MSNLVLSIFPGIDLLGRGFEEEGFCVVRGPDVLWGGDIRTFHPPPGVFDGIIGGPPCQAFSTAIHISRSGTKARDLIPEFMRIVREASPRWVVMENVIGAAISPSIPRDWLPVKLRDWDCGGLTHRSRLFWIWPPTLILAPPKRPGKPEYSVLATSWKTRPSRRFRGHSYISLDKAAQLQGFPDLADTLRPYGRASGVKFLGNGVPRSMGLYIARAIKAMEAQP